jgi:tetratricopeptide (TPR) repeat protein
MLARALALILVSAAVSSAPSAHAQPAAQVDAGTAETARQLVRAAQERGPGYRAEAGRQLEALGDVAVPALIEAKGPDFPPEMRRWAVAVLEAMNKKIPGEAIQTKDNDLLAQVLLAYGKTRDLDAVGVVFAFANVDRTNVREASREAIRLYGDGAISKLRETYTNMQNRAPSDAWGAPELAKELFKVMDHSRLREVYTLLDDAITKGKQAGDDPAKLAQAAALFDQVLARQPLLDRRAEAVPLYVHYAHSLEDGDAPRALAYYRKAERLGPEGADKDRIASAILYLEAKEAAAHGVIDAEAFRRAAALDPRNEKARAELVRLDADEQAAKARVRHSVMMAVAALIVVSALILFVRPRRLAR